MPRGEGVCQRGLVAPTLDVDYLVVGAGAMGMGFADVLVDHSDARVAVVDRRHGAGGHWLEDYPFVRLHQASTFYGVASTVLSRHGATRAPTVLRPIGLVGQRDGARINLAQYALPLRQAPKAASVVAVLGASMNAGKTTAAAALVRGLRNAGRRVAAAKVTGTGAGGDVWLMADSGAERVLDFTAAGVPSTYRLPFPDVERVFRTLTGELMASGVDAIVLEVADGILQRETRWLATSEAFRDTVDGVLFAVRDALSAP